MREGWGREDVSQSKESSGPPLYYFWWSWNILQKGSLISNTGTLFFPAFCGVRVLCQKQVKSFLTFRITVLKIRIYTTILWAYSTVANPHPLIILEMSRRPFRVIAFVHTSVSMFDCNISAIWYHVIVIFVPPSI